MKKLIINSTDTYTDRHTQEKLNNDLIVKLSIDMRDFFWSSGYSEIKINKRINDTKRPR